MKVVFRRVALAYGRFLFRTRDRVFPLVLVLLMAVFTSAPRVVAHDEWVDGLGVALVLLGVVVRVAVVGLAYIKRGGVNKQVYARDLVTDGLFAHCRNPLYVGNLATLAGYFVILGNLWITLFGALFFLTAYGAIVMTEEAYLADRFGAGYAAYCRQVPRWLFRLRGLGSTFRGMRFNWRRVLAKEYGSLAVSAVMLAAVLAYDRWVEVGLAHARGALLGVVVVAVISATAVLLVSSLKHSGRLKAS